jgi:hypothetical protein
MSRVRCVQCSPTTACSHPQTSEVFAKHADWPGLIINRVEGRARLKPTITLTLLGRGNDALSPLRFEGEGLGVRVNPNRRGRWPFSCKPHSIQSVLNITTKNRADRDVTWSARFLLHASCILRIYPRNTDCRWATRSLIIFWTTPRT